jgi:hypothetical protein
LAFIFFNGKQYYKANVAYFNLSLNGIVCTVCTVSNPTPGCRVGGGMLFQQQVDNSLEGLNKTEETNLNNPNPK